MIGTRLTGIRVMMMVTLGLVAVGSLGVYAADQIPVPVRPDELSTLNAMQCLTYIVLAMIALTAFLAWMGFNRLAGIENAIREHIAKLDSRKCLLMDKDYMQELRHPGGAK